jgi:DNA-binding LytR/AlgR family response regulator
MLFIKSNSKLLKVQTKDVYYVEALKDYVIVNTLNGRFTIHSTMKDIEAADEERKKRIKEEVSP